MMATSDRKDRNAVTIIWRIENISWFQRDFHEFNIWSSDLQPCNLEKTCIYLLFKPRGDEDLEDVHLRLESDFNNYLPFPLDCEFSFMACDGSPILTRKGIPFFDAAYEIGNCLTQEELFVTKKFSFLPHDTLTVRCRIWKSDGNFQYPEFISTRSRIEYAEESVLWPIKEFRATNLSWNENIPVEFQLSHKSLHFDLKCSLTSYLLQYPKLNIAVNSEKIIHSLLLKLQVSVLYDRCEIMKLGEREHSFLISEMPQTWIVPEFVLMGNCPKEILLLKFCQGLSIVFRFTAIYADIPHCIEETYLGACNPDQYRAIAASTFSEASCRGDSPDKLQRRNDCLGILGENLFSLYQKQTFSDIQLRAGEVSFPVHKVILSARSPVFNSMFSSEMKESKSNFLDIPDLDAHTLNQMLTFLYGGTVEPDLTVESADKLYYAADKYQVDSLKCLCTSILQSRISVSNASDIVVLADRHQDSDLMTFVHDFILSHMDDVMDSKEWEMFLDSNPVLAGKCMHLLYKKKRESRKRKNSQ